MSKAYRAYLQAFEPSFDFKGFESWNIIVNRAPRMVLKFWEELTPIYFCGIFLDVDAESLGLRETRPKQKSDAVVYKLDDLPLLSSAQLRLSSQDDEDGGGDDDEEQLRRTG